MKARVLYVVRPAEGGIRQHLLSILGRLNAKCYEATVGAPKELLSSIPERLIADREIIPIAPRFSLGQDIAASRRINCLAPHFGIVHAHGLRAAWVASLAHLRHPFPFVATAHNLVESYSGFTRIGLSLIGRRASRVIAVSQAICDGLIACGVPKAKIVVIPNGVDIDRFARLPPRDAAREELAARAEGFVVGCIARLSEEKGVDVLLAAAELLPELTFLIAGDGPDRSSLAHTPPKNVRFLGRIADIRSLLATTDIVAIPSRSEGQGIVAVEAMAAGVPIIASRVGGLTEMLTDGATALLVPPNNPAALAQAMTRMEGNEGLRRRLADQAASLVREKYSLSQMMESLESVYVALLTET